MTRASGWKANCAAFLLCAATANAAPSITLSQKSGPPTSSILVSGSGFGAHAGVDIYFDTKDEALVITDSKGAFDRAKVYAPRDARPGQHWVTALERNNDKGAQEQFLVQTDWPQFRFDVSHSGFNPYENVLDRNNVGRLFLMWENTTLGSPVNSPSLSKDVVYVDALGTSAVNALTGQFLWQQGYISETTGMSVIDNTIYLGSNGAYFYALDAETGDIEWQSATNVSNGAPAVVNGVVYVHSVPVGDTLSALDAKTGAVLWSNQTDVSGGDSSPAVANGALYVGSYNGNVYALDARTGALLWKYATGSYIHSSPTVSDGMVFVGSDDHNVYALDARTGSLLWKYATGDNVDSSPAVIHGVVYVGSYDSNLYALKERTGSLLWKFTTGAAIYSSPAVANGVVYFGSSDSHIYALDASTGALLWHYLTSFSVPSSPAVANGILYVGSFSDLYAFGISGTTTSLATKRPDPRTLCPDFSLKPLFVW